MNDVFSGLETVFTGTDRIRVEMVKTILLAEGVFYQVEGEGFTGLMGIQPDVLGMREIKIKVRTDDVKRAREILSRQIDGYEMEMEPKEE